MQVIVPCCADLSLAEHLHWTVVIFERHQTSAQHLDLLLSLKSTIDERYFHQCMKELDKDYRDKLILAGQCPVQSNGYDCGVHVLANAVYHMAGIEAPLAHDYALWRRICRNIYFRRPVNPYLQLLEYAMEEETATPTGEKIALSAIMSQDVSIGHRMARSVRTGNNQGDYFNSEPGKRTKYDQHLEWPIINKFPKADITYQPTIAESKLCITTYCVLPDYWKFHVLRLNLSKR